MEAGHDKIADFSDGQKPLVQRNLQDCAFEGALMALAYITDAAHLVHAPSGCIGSFLANSSNAPTLNKIRFTTDMEESDIIFGGAKKLYKAILEVYRRYHPKAIFVYSTCVSAMIGDDINGTTHDAAEKLGIPVIAVDSPGFVGNKNSGIRLAGNILLDHVIGTVEPEFTTKYDINLMGNNYNDCTVEFESLLTQIGIRVLAKITANTEYKQIAQAHRAKLNVVLSSKPLLKMAKQMEQRFDISYIEESLHNIEAINNCLINIAQKLGDTKLIEKAKTLVVEQNDKLNSQIELYRSHLKKKHLLIDVTSISVLKLSVLKNLELNIFPIAERLDTEVRQLLDNEIIILEKGNEKNQILQIIQDCAIDILMAPANYQSIAIQAQIPFLDNQNFSKYTGYAGILKGVQELYTALKSPIWKQLIKSAPWS
jgi:nitrogenase molybdenum-cofactor synthesis protein NifE